MVVSTETPRSMAQTEELPPRWQLARRRSAGEQPSSSGTRRLTYSWEAPWKPYFSTP